MATGVEHDGYTTIQDEQRKSCNVSSPSSSIPYTTVLLILLYVLRTSVSLYNWDGVFANTGPKTDGMLYRGRALFWGLNGELWGQSFRAEDGIHFTVQFGQHRLHRFLSCHGPPFAFPPEAPEPH